MKIMKRCVVAATAILLSTQQAHSATQGSLGATSTGVANISVTKSVQAQISDISDMTLANWSIGDGNVVLYSNVCIYSSTGNYTVTASGNGLLGAFTLSTGNPLTVIPYTVQWNGGGVNNLSNSGTALLSGIASTGFTTANSSSSTCSGGGANDTARVVVNISSTIMTAAVSSNTAYTGTLTMLVTPY